MLDDEEISSLEEETPSEELDEGTIEKNHKIVLETCEPLILDDDDLEKIKDLLLKEIKRGLCRHTHMQSVVKCYPTFVKELPKGCEYGNFISLDIGSSKFQIVLVQLQGDSQIKLVTKHYNVSNDIKKGPGRDLFDYMATCLSNFVHHYEIENEDVHVALTFCFPVHQIGLSKGILTKWTKGFKCSGVVGRDVVALLREAINRREDLQIGEIVVLNDTTDILMSCAWQDKSTKIGVIIDNGTNACYLEKTKHMSTIKTKLNSPSTMIVNTEWGAFGEDGKLDFIITKFDKLLDENSPNPGDYIYEKLISGLYLGELVRLIIIECANLKVLFKGRLCAAVNEKNSISTNDIFEFLKDDSEDYMEILKFLTNMGFAKLTTYDCHNIRYICEKVVLRSAHLLAAAISCIIDRIGDTYIGVGIDGFIYQNYPDYGKILFKTIKHLTRPEHKFHLVISDEGKGRGAALVAAVAAYRKMKLKTVK